MSGQEVQEFYNQYPFPNDKVQSLVALDKHAWILRVLKDPLQPRCRILDVGCGTGEIACFLAEKVKKDKGEVIGIDFSERSLQEAVSNASRFNLKNIQFRKLDITQDSLFSYEFNYIFSIGVLHHIPEVELALQNIKGMMNPETLFIASVYHKNKQSGDAIAKVRADAKYNKERIMDEAYHPYEHCYSRGEFRELLEKNGFEILNEWRKLPDWIRMITKKGGMITFLCRRKI